MQKWPASITMERHGESEYNAIDLADVPFYREFRSRFDEEYAALKAMSQTLFVDFPQSQRDCHIEMLKALQSTQFPSDKLKALAIRVQYEVEQKFPNFLKSDEATFERDDRPENRPRNCSITRFVGVPGDLTHSQHGWYGWMEREYANKVFWK